MEWTDYVRDGVSPRQCMEMQSHLRAGCVNCTDHWEFLCRLTDVGAREAAYEVPESAERAAKALFKNRQPGGSALEACLERLRSHPPVLPPHDFTLRSWR